MCNESSTGGYQPFIPAIALQYRTMCREFLNLGFAKPMFCNSHEDVNGEKLTVKRWWIFGADFSRFTQSFSWFIRDINGEKNISLLMIFFTVSFSRFTPLSKFGAFHENDGKMTKMTKTTQTATSKGVDCWNLRKSRKARKWRKPRESRVQNIWGVLYHHLNCEMKSPHLVDFSWDFVDFWSNFGRILPIFSWF